MIADCGPFAHKLDPFGSKKVPTAGTSLNKEQLVPKNVRGSFSQKNACLKNHGPLDLWIIQPFGQPFWRKSFALEVKPFAYSLVLRTRAPARAPFTVRGARVAGPPVRID